MGLQDPHPFNFVDLHKTNSLQVDSRTLLFGAIFLFLLIISISSLVYFLYTCIRRSRSQSAIGSRPTTTTTSPSPPPTGLDKATIGCLPIVPYGSGLSAGACLVRECSICLSAFEDGEKVKVLPLCGHGFHSECVDEWLRSRSSCPLCRACVVRVDSLAQSDSPCSVLNIV